MPYVHVPHPRHHERRPPQTVAEQAGNGLNGKIALWICAAVGTMACAYIFVALALISLPAALSSGQIIIIVAWIAQTFLQLVLLPIIIVGQNIQGKAADARADSTYKDAEAILSECLALQAHLQAQDEILSKMTASPPTKRAQKS